MRILKQKIRKSDRTTNHSPILPDNKEQDKQAIRKKNEKRSTRNKNKPIQKRNRIPGHTYTKAETLKTKNIMKNYARAICAFAVDQIAYPYLEQILAEFKIKQDEFKTYMKELKDQICSIKAFRDSLLPSYSDGENERSKKKAFQKIGEIFMKYFSVNWVFTSRIGNKMEHLKYRFKILRRIQNPHNFVYLK